MYFNDGQKRRVLIPFAAYRPSGKGVLFGAAGQSPAELAEVNTPNHVPLGDSTISPSTRTDAWLNANIPNDPNTAKHNCDVWMRYSDTAVVRKCRNVIIDGAGCDLPNIQTLARIFCDADFIDAHDNTVSSRPTFALGSINPQGYWCIGDSKYNQWTNASTRGASTNLWLIYANGGNGSMYLQDTHASYDFPIIPILELAA